MIEPSRDIQVSGFINIHKSDELYRSPAPFTELVRATVNTVRLQKYLDQLTGLGDASPQLLKGSLRVVTRAAAIDTGAIEKLYDVDRGFTLTVATEVASWQAVLEAKGAEVKSLISAQLEAYDYVLDLATGRQPIAEAWIRQLHAVICAGQEMYNVVTEVGTQQQSLPKGSYKVYPNHVLDRHGKSHPYAPVDTTPAEVSRLVRELQSKEFLDAHPVLQAAYAHYAFVVIHPFADGNGRVARALASVPTYRAYGVPLLILVEQRAQYIESLEAADRGDYQGFVDFVFERTLDALQLAHESFRTAAMPEADESFNALKKLYVTKGGLTHSELDEAARRAMETFQAELEAQSRKFVGGDQVSVRIDRYAHEYKIPDPTYRSTLNFSVPGVRLTLAAAAPAATQMVSEVQVEVPKDPGGEDDLILRTLENQNSIDTLAVRVSEAVPGITDSVRMRLTIFAERTVRRALNGLLAGAQHALRQQGFRG
jgi:Fic family protein